MRGGEGVRKRLKTKVLSVSESTPPDFARAAQNLSCAQIEIRAQKFPRRHLQQVDRTREKLRVRAASLKAKISRMI